MVELFGQLNITFKVVYFFHLWLLKLFLSQLLRFLTALPYHLVLTRVVKKNYFSLFYSI